MSLTPINSSRPDLEIRGFPFGHYLANPDSNHPFIVSAIPKCGCSTVKRWLCRTMNDDPSAIPGGAIHKHCRDRYALINFRPKRARKLLESSFTFTILRDPALRLASAYVAKFGRVAWELDALTPNVLADLVREAVLEVRDDHLWELMEKIEDEGRQELRDIVDGLA